MAPLAAAGWHVLAPEQRGYGWSSKPRNVTDYGIEHLTGDLLALVDEVAGPTAQAVFVAALATIHGPTGFGGGGKARSWG